jgi:hypothetical protein
MGKAVIYYPVYIQMQLSFVIGYRRYENTGETYYRDVTANGYSDTSSYI